MEPDADDGKNPILRENDIQAQIIESMHGQIRDLQRERSFAATRLALYKQALTPFTQASIDGEDPDPLDVLREMIKDRRQMETQIDTLVNVTIPALKSLLEIQSREVSALRSYEATCHCGEPASYHGGYDQNHSFTPLTEPCPFGQKLEIHLNERNGRLACMLNVITEKISNTPGSPWSKYGLALRLTEWFDLKGFVDLDWNDFRPVAPGEEIAGWPEPIDSPDDPVVALPFRPGSPLHHKGLQILMIAALSRVDGQLEFGDDEIALVDSNKEIVIEAHPVSNSIVVKLEDRPIQI